MTIDSGGVDELIRPGVAALRLGRSTRTLADWADAGIITAVRVGGGHRRYRAADIDALIVRDEQVTAAGESVVVPADQRRAGRSRGSYVRRGRVLTASEVAQLAAAPSVQAWAELAAGYQANGSSIRQIAASTGTLPATVAARITRYNAASAAGKGQGRGGGGVSGAGVGAN